MRFRARSAAVEGSGRWMGDNNKNLRFVGGLVFRSDVVGSLLRPASLKKAREQHEARQINDAEFKSLEDRAVDEAVELQRRAGVDVITDGEMRRYAFYGHLIDAVDGFDQLGGWAIPFRNEKGEELVLPRPVVVSKLRTVLGNPRATMQAGAPMLQEATVKNLEAYFGWTLTASEYVHAIHQRCLGETRV